MGEEKEGEGRGTWPSLALGNLALRVSSSSLPRGAPPDFKTLMEDRSYLWRSGDLEMARTMGGTTGAIVTLCL